MIFEILKSFRLDLDNLSYQQLKSEAELTMKELTTLAQHTSVSSIFILHYKFALTYDDTDGQGYA